MHASLVRYAALTNKRSSLRAIPNGEVATRFRVLVDSYNRTSGA